MTNLTYTMIFLRYQNSLLMLNRRKPPLMGLWTGVGGKIEPGESPEDCARREVLEETGFSVSHLFFAGINTWISDAKASGMYLYTAEIEGPFYPTPRKVDEGILEWQELNWVLDSQNEGMPVHVKGFLPALLAGKVYEHRCYFEGDVIVKSEQVGLH